MNIKIAVLLCGGLLLLQRAIAGPTETAALSQYTEAFAKELKAGGLHVALFDGAVLDSAEPVVFEDQAKGTLCWIKNEKGRCGYILLANTGNQLNLIGFSETVSPPPFLPHIAAPSDKKGPPALRRVASFSFTPGVPLVAAKRIRTGTTEVVLTDESCSLASVFGYLQYVKGIPLLGHMGYFLSPQYISMTPSLLSPDEKDKLLSEYRAAMLEAKKSGWKPFAEEVGEALAKEKIVVSAAQTPRERAELMIKAREIVRPIRHRRLMSPVTPEERFDLMLGEVTEIERIAGIDTSRGMRDAFLLQEDYLSTDKPQEDILAFFYTRGLKAKVGLFPLSGHNAFAPCVLTHGGRVLGVLLGYINIDGIDFAFVFVPKTGVAIRAPLSTKLRIPEDKNVTATQPSSENSEVAIALQRWRAAVDKTVVVEDPISAFPKIIQNGVHVLRVSTLTKWHEIRIEEIIPADNWGPTLLKQRKDGNQ